MSERYKSINQISELTGKDRRTIKKKILSLPIHSTHGRAEYYDLHLALPLLFSNGNEKDTEKEMIDEQLRYERARADKMILEVEQRRGEVVATSEVARIVAAEYTNVRARLLSIPSRCAKDLSIESNPSLVKERLDQEINEALAELTADEKFEENQHVDQSSSNSETDSTEDTKATLET
jgi:phage terminase Nu1 subunit (DNA packaging protein)